MIIDTGILVGLADRDDPYHEAARALFEGGEPLVVPEPVITEADYLIRRLVGLDPEVAFMRGLNEGAFTIECPTRADRDRAANLVAQYRDAAIGYVDAVTVAIAERLRERRIATVDRRHFAMVHPRHVRAFELVP